MDFSKTAFVGVTVVLPMTAGLAVTTGLLYREVDRNRSEITELKRTVMSLHGMAIPQIPASKKTDAAITVEPSSTPALPSGDIKVPITANKGSGIADSEEKPSAGALQQGGDKIRLMDEDQSLAVHKKQDITLIGDGKSEDE